ncbi:MAG: PrpR N-terminal domain-containing protein [Lachnospiraceae bacterium]|nr:PrpR N-terminal domain-containing protein [Lachnospiraceae bacterium]
MKHLHLLACAPSPELVQTYRKIAAEFASHHTQIIVGGAQQAASFLEMHGSASLDAVIIPAGSIERLTGVTDLPVIETELTVLDVLRVIRQTQQYCSEIAIVVHALHARLVRQVCEIMQYDYRIFTVSTQKETRQLMNSLYDEGVEMLIGEADIAQAASKAGINSVILTPGEDDIRKSFQQAQAACMISAANRDRLYLFRLMADQSPFSLAILDSAGTFFYTNTRLHSDLSTQTPSPLQSFLRRSAPQVFERRYIHITKKLSETTFEIWGKAMEIQESSYAVFYYREAGKYLPRQSVISIENYDEIPARRHYFFNTAAYLQPIRKQIESTNKTKLPVLIYGQPGTGRQYVARQLHLQGSEKNDPFVFVKCNTLTEKLWENMIADPNSPLYGNSYTLYFHDIHTLSLPVQNMITDFIEDTHLPQRCRIISSTTRNLAESVASEHFLQKLYLITGSYTIRIPTLNDRMNELPSFCGIILNHFNERLSRQVIGFDEDALRLLRQLPWTLNFEQLQKVIHQLVADASGSYITAGEIQESFSPILPAASSDAEHAVHLSGTLDEIEAEIISSVLAEEHMNQSACAKRLGISRSTLWRKLRI